MIASPVFRRAGVALLVSTVLVAAACGRDDAPSSGAPAADAVLPDSGGAGTARSRVSLTADQLARLQVQPVTRTTFRPVLQTTGSVAFDADVSTQVLAPMSGPVVRILAQPGATVSRGQALAIVSSPDFATAVADFRKAQGAAVQAQRVAEQNEQLWKNDAIARRDLEQAQTDAAAAAADRDAAMQQLRALGVDEASISAIRDNAPVQTAQGTIRAPIGGTVVERLVTPGQLLEAGATPAFTIADLSRMWVEANVFESDLPFVRVGDRADVSTAALSMPLHGTVTYIAALVDPTTKATAVRIEVPNTQRVLKRDMYVDVAIHSARAREGVLVPVGAVLRDEDNLPFVYVQVGAADAGSFARRAITLGVRTGDRYEVLDGLEPGERVITEGGLFVQFAQSQ